MKNINYIYILFALLFSFNLSFSQDSIKNNADKELIELLDKARIKNASSEQLREIIKVYRENELRQIVRLMIDNGETEQDISFVINDYNEKYNIYPKKENVYFTPDLIERLSAIGVIVIILIILYFIYKKRKLIIRKLNTFINSSLSTYALELVFPIVLTSLFYMLVETKRMSVDRDTIAGLVSFLFFFILVLEWIRRKKDKTERAYYFKYLYIGLMLLVFVLGVWYANELVVDYQAPKRTKSIFAF